MIAHVDTSFQMMTLSKFESDSGDGGHTPYNFMGYFIRLDWVIGRITGAYIESPDVSHFLSFDDNKATLAKIVFSTQSITFQRHLPATINRLYSTVFISEAKYYSLG